MNDEFRTTETAGGLQLTAHGPGWLDSGLDRFPKNRYPQVVPISHNPEVLKPFLLRDESATRSIYNTVFGRAGARVVWIRVDDLKRPQAVICRSRVLHRRQMLYMYARNPKAAERVLAEIPKKWRLAFAATPARLVPAVRRALKKRGRKLDWISPCYLYVLEPSHKEIPMSKLQFPTKSQVPNPNNTGPQMKPVPGGLVIDRKHRVGRLRPGDAGLIAQYWPHGRNPDYIRWRIRSGPNCAIRRNGKLVACAITHADGSMGILHVLEEYRGLGMARSITTALAERCLKAGLKPFLYIVKRNKASINLTESMGFTRQGVYCWFGE
jgi:GNAT superfamily N-acetyltransferase